MRIKVQTKTNYLSVRLARVNNRGAKENFHSGFVSGSHEVCEEEDEVGIGFRQRSVNGSAIAKLETAHGFHANGLQLGTVAPSSCAEQIVPRGFRKGAATGEAHPARGRHDKNVVLHNCV